MEKGTPNTEEHSTPPSHSLPCPTIVAESSSNNTDQTRTRENYDQFIYPSGVYYHTHPDRIAIAGALAGLTPVPVDQCRVLELGCSDGGNLNAMASSLGGSEFVGIDLAPRQIALANESKAAAGIENISFHGQSFTEMGEEFGEFDYIIGHGLFSWIPAPLQSELLAACRRLLSPNGLLYMSFNVLPGARNLLWLREKLLFHIRDLDDPRQRAESAWQFSHFIAKMQEVQSGAYHTYMQKLLATFTKMDDPQAYFFHEYLEVDNNPLLLTEFIKLAETNNLRYLRDAAPRNRNLDGVDPGLAKVIRQFTDDPLTQEQYLDLALETPFRRAILCRSDADLSQPLRDSLPTSWLATCQASPTESTSGPETCFAKSGGQRHCTEDPATISVLEKLTSRWPAAVPLSELQPLFNEPEDSYLRAPSSKVLYDLYWNDFIRLHPRPLPAATEISSRPLTSAFVRSRVGSSKQVPTVYHSNVAMDDAAACTILAALDGCNDHDQLATILLEAVRSGDLAIKVDDAPLQDHPEAETIARQIVDEKLEQALSMGLRLAV